MKPSLNNLNHYFSNCRRILGNTAWDRILAALEPHEPDAFVRRLGTMTETEGLPPFLKELAALEMAFRTFCRSSGNQPEPVEVLTVNPKLLLLPVQWQHLPHLLEENAPDAHHRDTPEPKKREGHILIWRSPTTGHVHCRDAADDDLLALKLVVEGIDPEALSAREKTPIGKIQAIIHRAVDQGLLIAPETKIVRTPNRYAARSGGESFLKSDVFTLQWHVTQACDLHCRHCYDRSDRTKMSFADARRILDD
ncbi:MAG: hypothetical protein MI802_04500, partial [Desulfobacterales bacterium]|nr:hypothetical protein [Desulfobacterales bacterium]